MAKILVLLAGLSLLPSADSAPIAGPPQAFNEAARLASPSVVSISAVRTVSPQEASQQMPPFGMPFPFPPGPGGREPGIGMGSGVVIRGDGVILTNHHVVEGAEKVTVGIDDTTKVRARVMGVDPKTDVAVLKIEPKDMEGLRFRPISFGDSGAVEVGDWAIAIGSPFGLSHTVTSGIISAKGRGHLGVIDIEDFIQTDAAINPGNSGGPLLNIQGQMIGLNAAIFSQSGGFVGIGFSIPSNLVRQIADQILDHGRVIRGWVGLSAQDVDPKLASFFKLKEPKGALVSDVKEGSPAAKSELKAGDVIVRYDGREVRSAADLKLFVGRTKIGSDIPVQVMREGSSRNIALAVREQPVEKPLTPVQQAGRLADGDESPGVGVALQEIPDELAPVIGAKPGDGALVMGVRPGSPAFDAGLSVGDVILKGNGKRLRGASETVRFLKEASKKEELTVLYVQRGPAERIFVPLDLQSEG